MAIITKYWVLAFTLQVCYLRAESIPIHIDDKRDYEILAQFLKMGVLEEGYGYVLQGIKPVSIRNFYGLDEFPIAKDLKYAESEFAKTLLVKEVIPIWNRLCSHQKNFVLKAVNLQSPGSIEPFWEIQFINISALKRLINKNINLFRYVLGPAVHSEQIVEQIAYSDEELSNILHHDLVLEGIVLGFGTHNSLVGGRSETLLAQTISRDCAPFIPKHHLMKTMGLPPECYGSYFLAFNGGDDSCFKKEHSLLQPSSGFLNVEEELLALDSMNETFPPSLMEKPEFIFGAFKGGPSNRPFFKHLQQVQKQVQTLLQKPDFFEQVLEKIGGEKPLITCDKPAVFCPLLFFSENADVKKWVRILKSAMNHFEDKERKLAFIEAFSHPSASFRSAPKMMGASKAELKGLKTALRNLAVANTFFETLSKDTSLEEILPKQLYFRTTFTGVGKELKGTDRVRIGYIIEDLEGTVLFAHHDMWLSLSETIPGLAYGTQGMHVGEKRTLQIHPTLAYGAMTTLPPCIGLTIKVHLLDVDEKSTKALTSLKPLDLTWIQNPLLYSSVEESLRQQPYYAGSFYRDLLDKITELDKISLIAELTSTRSLEDQGRPQA